MLGGVIMLPALLLTAAAATPLSAILLIAVILFGFQTAIGNIQTLPSDFFSGKSVGSLAGVGGAAAVAGVLITTELIPRKSRPGVRSPLHSLGRGAGAACDDIGVGIRRPDSSGYYGELSW